MTNPLALLPLAIAAGGGRIGTADETTIHDVQQLVAAGLTLLQRSAPLVRALMGRRAAILMPTSPQFLVALAASEGRGAVLVNPLAAPAEIAFQCADADVGAVYTIGALAKGVPAGVALVLLDDAPRRARVITADRSQDVDLGSHHGLSLAGEAGAPGRDEEAAIVYTSAMLGTALGAVLTHGNLLANARSSIEALGIGADDHVLALLPFSHLFGLTVTASAPLLVGARVSTMDRFHPVRAGDLLGSGVSIVVGVPAVFHALLAGFARRGTRVRNDTLRLCVCGGAVLPLDLQERWFDATGIELRQGYGLTEAAPVCLFNRTDSPNVRGTLGLPFPGVDVAILLPSGAPGAERTAPLPDGMRGEICVRGMNLFRGYVRHDAAGLPWRDDWLCTGDEGMRNPDGTFTFLGVRKAMFTRSGFNVYPREIERVVSEMPGIVWAEATPIPVPVKEHDIRLRVSGPVAAVAVREWCESRLAAYKVPTLIEVENGSDSA